MKGPALTDAMATRHVTSAVTHGGMMSPWTPRTDQLICRLCPCLSCTSTLFDALHALSILFLYHHNLMAQVGQARESKTAATCLDFLHPDADLDDRLHMHFAGHESRGRSAWTRQQHCATDALHSGNIQENMLVPRQPCSRHLSPHLQGVLRAFHELSVGDDSRSYAGHHVSPSAYMAF